MPRSQSTLGVNFNKKNGAGTQRLAKNLPFNFTNILPQSVQLNSPNLWPKIPEKLPNLCAICQTPCAICHKRRQILQAKKSRMNVDEIDLRETSKVSFL
jgi:hypothetical protein